MALELSGISRSFDDLAVLEGIDLSIEEGSLLAVLGPSGCGKTTLLRIMAGLDPGFSGKRGGFESLRFSYVFQEHRLLPWRSAIDNALFALAGSGLDGAAARERAMRFLALAGLAGHEDRPVRELSGGMRQRAALARAFAYPADVLLLDEAFQAVDIRMKRDLMGVFLDLRAAEGHTCVLVTHDPDEALWLADRIVVLSARPARIVEDIAVTAPRDKRNPGSRAVAPIESRLYASLLA